MSGMRIELVEGGDQLNRMGADVVTQAIAATPTASVVAATGHTPVGLYAELGARCRAGLLDTTAISVFQLDEYLGLEDEDRRHVVRLDAADLRGTVGRDRRPRGRTSAHGDLDAACAAFDRALESRGGLDLAILGLGANGHWGSTSPFGPEAPTRVVELSPRPSRPSPLLG